MTARTAPRGTSRCSSLNQLTVARTAARANAVSALANGDSRPGGPGELLRQVVATPQDRHRDARALEADQLAARIVIRAVRLGAEAPWIDVDDRGRVVCAMPVAGAARSASVKGKRSRP